MWKLTERNDFPVRKSNENEKPVVKAKRFSGRKIGSRVLRGASLFWSILGYGVVFTAGIVMLIGACAFVWHLLGWYLVPIVLVTINVVLMWTERNDEIDE